MFTGNNEFLAKLRATRERNRRELETLALLTGKTVAQIEADVCAPDLEQQEPHRPDECLACELHKVTLTFGIFELTPSVPIHWCTEMWTAWPKLRRFISTNIPTVPDWCPRCADPIGSGGREA